MEDDRGFRFLLDKIRRNRGIDFGRYRPQVLKRRIQHRLRSTGCNGCWDYVLLLNRDPEEYDRLIEALTIKVSEFFRHPTVFEVLADPIAHAFACQGRSISAALRLAPRADRNSS